MSLLKKDQLQKSAGLLNSAAPEDHFLAYITAEEKNMLVAAGGKETPTPSGVNAYPYWDDGGGQSKSEYDAGGGMDHQGNQNTGGNDNQDSDETSWSAEDHTPTGWSGDSGTDAWESEHGDQSGSDDYQGTQFTGGTYATDKTPASRTLSYGNDAATEDMGRPDITYFEPTGTRMGDYKSKYELNQIKYIQDAKLSTVKSKLRKNGYDIPKDANFAETKAFINDLSNDELPDSYKDLKDKNGNPLYEQATLDKWEELGYIPEGGSMKLPGVGGAILNKFDKPLTRDELWADLDAATEVGKSGGGAMDWQERMKTYSPNQYASMTGMDYNPLTKEFTQRSGGNEQDAVTRISSSYQIGQTAPQESQAAKWFANLGGNQGGFNLTQAYADAKTKQASILGQPSPMKYLAVSQSPFFEFLKEHKLNKGIL